MLFESQQTKKMAGSSPLHPPKEPSCLSLNSDSFYSERGESKVKHFLVPISLQRECVNFFLLQPSQVSLVRMFLVSETKVF